MKQKIILDLCGGTGSWSKPYKDAGYDVRLVTLPDNDVRTYVPPKNVYGILAAPPCTDFANSGARWFAEKDGSGITIESQGIVIAVLRIIAQCKPKWWALENPVGRIRAWLGDPALLFNPCDYGDPYTKKTLLWGEFNIPKKHPVSPTEGSKMWKQYGGKSEHTKMMRSITPPPLCAGFL
ncbi:hypothetical protein FACS1894109_15560 [Spirochaetia bacterium]|nr:hypothetical protein FACS1894109_15560 [Spirochaetia bacterium]